MCDSSGDEANLLPLDGDQVVVPKKRCKAKRDASKLHELIQVSGSAPPKIEQPADARGKERPLLILPG